MRSLSPQRTYFVHAFWMGMAMSVVFTYYMVFQVEVAGLNPLQLVLVGTALEISAFVFEIPTGVVADVYSRKLSVILGIFIIGAAFVMQGIPLFLPIVLGSVLWGLGFTFTSGAHQAWITDEIGVENVGKVFIRAQQFARVGSLAGIPLSVLLARLGLAVPIIAGGAAIISLGFFLIAAMREEGFSPTPPEERETWREMRRTLREGIALVRTRPVLGDFLWIGLFVGLYSEGYDRLWVAHLIDNIGFPEIGALDTIAWFGMIRFTKSLLGIGVNELARRRLNIDDLRISVRALQGLYAIMIAGLAVLAQTTSFPVALAVLLLFDSARELTFPIQSAWSNQFIDSNVRATVLSVQSQVDALGQMSGGPFIGALGNRSGLRTAMTGASAILLPVLPLYQRTLARKSEKPAS